MKKLFFIIVSFVLINPSYGAETFQCSRKIPEKFHLEKPAPCDDIVTWHYDLPEASDKSSDKAFESKVMGNVRETSNMGGAAFTFPSGVKKNVYRSSFLSGKEECLSYLVKEAKVYSIINYYQGTLKSADSLSEEERGMFASLGGKVYIRPLNYQYKFNKLPKEEVFDKVAEIIKLVEHAPGNVLVHCYGGIHRTGVVFGVMQKCLNKIPVEDVLNEYRCHAAWEDEKRPGGANQENEIAIREFPCEKLAE